MAIPKYDEMMLPLLRFLEDGEEHAQRDLAEPVADYFKLTTAERDKMLPSTRVTYLRHRLGWAGFSLRRAGLAEMPRTGRLRITDEGRKLLASNPKQLLVADLKRIPSYAVFIDKMKKNASLGGLATAASDEITSETPEELIASNYEILRTQLASELLQNVKKDTPTFFEKLVVELLIKMGYGGSRAEAGRATRPTSDGGIDGVIDEDRLGLDAVYVQAKRWEKTVGEPELRDFVGALHAHRARKGVFITTSDFSEPARRYMDKVDFKISLIDGRRLTELMIDFGVGVSLAHTYEIKKIDSDYFLED